MKKALLFLTFLLSLLISTSVQAKEATYTFNSASISKTGIKAGDNDCINMDFGGGGTATSPQSDHIRMYANNTLTINATNATISKVVINLTGTNANKIEVTTGGGTIAVTTSGTNPTMYTWTTTTPVSNLVFTNNGSAQARITSIVFTYETTGGGDDTPTCTKPAVSTEGDVFTITGDEGDTFYYTLKKGDETIATDAEYTAPVDPSANGYGTYTLTAYALREGAKKSATTDPSTITLVDPNGPQFYSVTLKTGSVTTGATSVKLDDVIEKGKEYLDGDLTGATIAAPATNGMKLGSTGAAGSVTFTMSAKGKVNLDKLIIHTTTWSDKESATYTLNINGTDVASSIEPGKDYEYVPKSATIIETIKITTSSKKRMYLNGFDVYIAQELTPCEKPEIVVDTENRTFTVTANGEDETLKYILSKDGVAGAETEYAEAIAIEAGAYGKYVLTAWAEKEGFAKSEEATATIDYQPVTCAAPSVEFDEATRTFTVTATEGTPYYTLTKDEVEGEKTPYTEAVVIPEFAYGKYVFTAWAEADGIEPSQKVTKEYNYAKPAATAPTIAIEGNKFVVTGDEDDTFYYTLKQDNVAVAENREYKEAVDPAPFGYGTFTLTAWATNPNKTNSPEVTSEAITLEDPNAPIFYTVTFKTADTNPNNNGTSVTLANAVKTGSEFLSGDITGSGIGYAYTNGLKIGTSSATGNALFKMSDTGKVYLEKLVINTTEYDSGVTYTLNINGNDVASNISASSGKYIYTPSNPIKIETIKITTALNSKKGRIYLNGFDVYYKDVKVCAAPEISVKNVVMTITPADEADEVTYSLTRDNEAVEGHQNATYTEPVNLKEIGYGKYVITAYANREGYEQSDAAVLVKNVVDPTPVQYGIVTEAAQLVDGRKVLFVYNDDTNHYVFSAANSNNFSSAVMNDEFEGNFFTYYPDDSAANPVTLNYDETNTGWHFLTDEGKYLAATGGSDKNYLKEVEDSNTTTTLAKITFSEGQPTVKFETGGTNDRNVLKFNSASDQKIFACYASGQKDILIYQEYVETPIEVAKPELSYAVTTGIVTVVTKHEGDEAKTYYTVNGDDPTTDGIAVEDGSIAIDSSCQVKAATCATSLGGVVYWSEIEALDCKYIPAPEVSIAEGETIKVGHSIQIEMPENVFEDYNYSYTLTTPAEDEIANVVVMEAEKLSIDEVGTYTLTITGHDEDLNEGISKTITFTAEAYDLYIENYHTYVNVEANTDVKFTYNNESKAYEVNIPELYGEFRIKSSCGVLNIGGHEEAACERNFNADGSKIHDVRARTEEQGEDKFNLSSRYVNINTDELTLVHGSEVNFSTHTAESMWTHKDVTLTLNINPEAVTNATMTADADAEAPKTIEVGSMKAVIGEPTETGVADISVDAADGEAVYYNLQGVRVAAPQPGQVVIERRGASTQKLRF